MTSSLASGDIAEWDALCKSVSNKIRALDESGCPNALTKTKTHPDTYKKFMLAALSRSYVMARWMMLDEARKSFDLDLMRVYDRFIDDPEVDHKAITPTVMAVRTAGHAQAAGVVTSEHFSRYDTLKQQAPGDFFGGLRSSDTNMEILYAAFITGTDANRRFISVSVESSLNMIRERNITTVEELLHVLNSAGDGSAVLRDGAL